MPNFPIVDSHLHIWDPAKIRYSWLDGVELLNKPHLLADYDRQTAAVDVGAKSEIYGLIDDLARAGKGIVFASTELEEYPVVCDRVFVFSQGAIVGELAGEALTEANIMTLAAGGEL